MADITLMLPHGYGKGTIVFDLESNPYEVVECLCSPLYSLRSVPKEYAEACRKSGAQILVSEK